MCLQTGQALSSGLLYLYERFHPAIIDTFCDRGQMFFFYNRGKGYHLSHDPHLEKDIDCFAIR